MKAPLTLDQLSNVYFRAQDADGHWGTVDAATATDAQFEAWAYFRVPVEDDDSVWSPANRLEFCNDLWMNGELSIFVPQPEPSDAEA